MVIIKGLRVNINRTSNKIFNRYEIVAKNARGIIALYRTAHTKRGANHIMAQMIHTINKFYKEGANN